MNNLRKQITEKHQLISSQKKLMYYEVKQIKNDGKAILSSPSSLWIAFLIGFILAAKIGNDANTPHTYAAQAKRNKSINKLMSLGKYLFYLI